MQYWQVLGIIPRVLKECWPVGLEGHVLPHPPPDCLRRVTRRLFPFPLRLLEPLRRMRRVGILYFYCRI
jgi:hypothetical protein